MTRRDAPATEFSVREFARTAQGSHRSELDLAAYRDHPLDQDTLEIVDLLSRLERGALSYLRSVLVTPTHKDARVTAFLVTWAYEKYWVADALELVVAAQPGYAPPPNRVDRLRKVRHEVGERLEPIRESVVANLIGEDVIAVHTAAGALDEWITQAAYERLAERSAQPEFSRTLSRLLDVKRRHATFFATDARERLAASPPAVRLARRRLRRTALPLDSQAESPRLLARLLGDVVPSSDLAAIDARADSLPGMAGLRLATAAAERARKAAVR